MINCLPSFFDSEVRRSLLLEEARRWIGTPFVAHGAKRGAGVDCVHLCAEIYKALGALDKFDPPRYSLDGGHHAKDEGQTVRGIEESGRFGLVWTPGQVRAAEAGDLLCFRNGRVAHHAGIVITWRTFIHSHRRFGVMESDLYDPTFMDRLTAIYRPLPIYTNI